MTDFAIRSEQLGKRYSTSLRTRSTTLREQIVATSRATVGALRGNRVPPRQVPEHWALRDVNLEIPQGASIGVIGMNGAGKSTLLKILARVTKPTEGFVDVAGRVGSLLEVGAGFHSELTGRENIRLYGAILGMSRAEVARKFDAIVEFAEIGDFLETPVKRYSTGMYMRLAFSVAAHLDPEILLVDEVLSVGDVPFQQRSMGRVRDIVAEGSTVLFVSHNLRAVRSLCPTSILLDQGRVLMIGNTTDVIQRFLEEHASGSRAGDWCNLDGARRSGRGEARFQAVRFEGGSSGEDAQPETNGPFVVETEVVSQQPLLIGSYSVALYDRFGTRIINAETALHGQKLSLHPGANRIRTRFPKLPLNPGRYTLGLWIALSADDPVGIDFIEEATAVEVFDPRMGFAGVAVDPGVVPCEFSVDGPESSARQAS
jgi:lipopolysaccharide transport system ATP-binding protein